MSTQSNDYHISFFKPANARTRANRNMVILLFCIWAVTIFGFQILLKIMEKPTPEEALINFNGVWQQVETDQATPEQLQTFAKSTLSVLGKVMITPEERAVLDDGLNWSVSKLADSALLAQITSEIIAFETVKASVTNIQQETYVEAKTKLENLVSPLLGLMSTDVRKKILPLELVSDGMLIFEDENKEIISAIMEKYLIHNRSVLTDISFLGFPFHYFYTAVFLLILFVGLCWLYCKRSDALNEEFNIED